jgi:acetyl esterase/lipase
MRSVCRILPAALLLAAFLMTGAPGPAQQPLPDDVELLRDVEYGKGGGWSLKMHILRPKTPPREPMPVVVWIHGRAYALQPA